MEESLDSTENIENVQNRPNTTSSYSIIQQLNEKIKEESQFVTLLTSEINKVIVGQSNMIEKLLIALIADGHVLLEGVPGLAKTLAIKTLSDTIATSFSRIQFTPDLLPADVVGTMIYNQKKEEFTVRKGPVFANFVLADEINRAPAKVQSALLQAMQEKEVTINNTTYKLPNPFLVLATQNPIEQEGTYPLPEAQVDRFMLKVDLDYPEKEEEKLILRQNISNAFPKANQVISEEQIVRARKSVREIYMDEKIETYIVDIVNATRDPKTYNVKEVEHLINYGGSPRATISMALAAKAYAFIRQRGYVIPEDIRAVCFDILRHRIGLSYEAEAENVKPDEVITEILNSVEVP